MTTMFRFGVCLLLLLASSAWSAVDVYEFDSEVDRQRYLSFTEEMRCPKCENQNLAGSNSPIAADLRREIYHLIQDGRSDKEITDFMVERYGDYVLYRPRFNQATFWLWLGPVALFLVGIVALIWIVTKRRAQSPSSQAQALSPEERQRLDALLNQTHSSNDPKSTQS